MDNTLSTILIVEDNADDYEATIRSFKRNHLLNPVQWKKNGQDAYDYLLAAVDGNQPACQIPSLILLDLNMPGMDGRQLLTHIKNNPAIAKIPIIILTTSANSKDINTCYQLGASTYIQKPVSFDGLTQAIRTMKDYWYGIALLPRDDEY